jgi:uncharacterized membrane protein YhaH (DUF805 family)
MDLVQLFFTTQGRVGRGKYWAIIGIWFLLDLLFRGGVSAAANWSGDEVVVAIFYWSFLVFSAASYFPITAVAVKRLHDAGYSGYWMMFQHGFILSLVLMLVAVSKMALGSLLFLSIILLLCGLGMLVGLILTLLPSTGANEHDFA